MKLFRTYLFSSVLLFLLASAAAVLPATAQTFGKPVMKQHQTIPAGKDCSGCHKKTFAEWKSGPHGANDVQCTVCHGDVTNTVAAVPAMSTCENCHADKVKQMKTDPLMSANRKTCMTCHVTHATKPHPKAA
jgi:hypothetical protein